LVTSYLPDAELEDITEIKAQLQETAPHALEGLDEVLRSWDIAKRKMEWAEWVSGQVASGYLEPSTS
jgi:CHAD domain-containing protein